MDNKLSEILSQILINDNYCINDNVSITTTKIIKSMNNLLESTNIIENIGLEILSLPINPILNDIPVVLNIILNSTHLIDHLTKLNINKKENKYYIFCILNYIIIKHNIIIDNNELITIFNLFWNFISFDLNKINKKCINNILHFKCCLCKGNSK